MLSKNYFGSFFLQVPPAPPLPSDLGSAVCSGDPKALSNATHKFSNLDEVSFVRDSPTIQQRKADLQSNGLFQGYHTAITGTAINYVGIFQYLFQRPCPGITVSNFIDH